MKKIITMALVAGSLAFFSACQSNSTEKKEQVNEDFSIEELGLTGITFDTVAHDFGQINQGEKVKHTYAFTNTGDKNLMLKSVKASCGCTVPDWTKKPIEPGETGEISVEFNSMGRKGIQQKTITVVSNTEPKTTLLHFTAEVLVPNKENN